jgi:hypothetical protein
MPLWLGACAAADGEGPASASDDVGSGQIDDASDASADTAADSESGSAGDDADDEATGDPSVDQIPPTGRDALVPWLEGESYADWAAESAPHPSAGPHPSTVRTYFNDGLAQSAAAGHAEHPIGAATVKELFDGDGERSGWAVMVKLEEGQGGDGWYWYEGVGSAVYADGTGVGLCVGCHVDGVDHVLTRWPLL